jgi:hypothetical protein
LLSLSSTIRISRVMTSISRALSIIGTAVWLLLISTALMRDVLPASKTNAWRNSSSMLMSLKVQLPAPLKLSDPTTHGRAIVSARSVMLQHIRKHGRLRQLIWIATQWAQVKRQGLASLYLANRGKCFSFLRGFLTESECTLAIANT